MKQGAPWRTSIIGFILGSFTVFVLNLVALLWSIRHGNSAAQNGSVVLQEGRDAEQCASIKSTNTWLHLLINILSTVILSGSNYCMQCLCAPTRDDIDKRHPKGKYLDIGVPSIHNLKYLSNRRKWTWTALLLSSLPLHLFYNSAVYTTASSNNYLVFSVGEDYVTANNASQYSYEDHSSIVDSGKFTSALNTPSDEIAEAASNLRILADNHTTVRLEPSDCMQAYLSTFQSGYRNLLLITDNETTTIKYLEARFYRDFQCNNEQASTWICAYVSQNTAGYSNQCTSACEVSDMKVAMAAAVSNNTWSPLGDPVKYCIAEPSPSTCTLEINTAIIIVVLVFNAVKMALMLFTLFYALPQSARPLLCLGDAVSSFLDVRDEASSEKCLLSRRLYKDLQEQQYQDLHKRTTKTIIGPLPQTYTSRRQHWSSAISLRRWCLCILIYLIGLGTAAVYLAKGIDNISGPRDFGSLWTMGFGSVNAQAIVMTSSEASGNATVISNVLLANIAQLILSLLYFTYNGLFTGMLLAREWDSYAVRRQGLRVNSTTPSGRQRNSYFLQLPYRWSLPLIAFSLVLHWLVSQSIFVVNIQMMDYFGLPLTMGPNRVGHLVTIGYSPIAIIIFIMVAGLLVIAVLITGRIRLRSAIPVAGSCSMAIAAACHPPPTRKMSASSDRDALLPLSARLLQWGDTGPIEQSHAKEIRAASTQLHKDKASHVGSRKSQSSVTTSLEVRNLQEVEMNFLTSSDDLVYLPDVRSVSMKKAQPNVQVSNVVVTPAQSILEGGPSLAEEQQGFLQSVDGRAESQTLYHACITDEPVATLIEGREYA